MNNFYATFVTLAAMLMFAGCNNQESAPVPASAASPAPAPAPTWLASSEGEYPGVTVAVRELKRGPYTLRLKFVVINHSNSGFVLTSDFADSASLRDDMCGIHLIDEANKRKYFVVQDAQSVCLSSGQQTTATIFEGSQRSLWAEFPAPPPEVQK